MLVILYLFMFQFSSVSHVRLFVTPLTAARQAPLSITISQSLLKLTSVESVMPSNDLILCHPLLLPPSIFPSIGLFKWVSSLHQVATVCINIFWETLLLYPFFGSLTCFRRSFRLWIGYLGNSLAVQRLGFHAFTAEGRGSVPGQGTKIP